MGNYQTNTQTALKTLNVAHFEIIFVGQTDTVNGSITFVTSNWLA